MKWNNAYIERKKKLNWTHARSVIKRLCVLVQFLCFRSEEIRSCQKDKLSHLCSFSFFVYLISFVFFLPLLFACAQKSQKDKIEPFFCIRRIGEHRKTNPSLVISVFRIVRIKFFYTCFFHEISISHFVFFLHTYIRT